MRTGGPGLSALDLAQVWLAFAIAAQVAAVGKDAGFAGVIAACSFARAKLADLVRVLKAATAAAVAAAPSVAATPPVAGPRTQESALSSPQVPFCLALAAAVSAGRAMACPTLPAIAVAAAALDELVALDDPGIVAAALAAAPAAAACLSPFHTVREACSFWLYAVSDLMQPR